MTTTFEPPAAAVAADAHWRTKMDRAKARKPLMATATLLDDDAADAVAAAQTAVFEALRVARQRLAADLKAVEPNLTGEEILARTEPDLHEQPEVVQANQALEDARVAQDEADLKFDFRALPSDVFEELVGKFPPTEAQGKRGEDYNSQRFLPALLAACCIDPMSERDAAELVGGEWQDDEGLWHREPATFSQGEASILVTTAVNVNQAARARLGKGSRPTPG